MVVSLPLVTIYLFSLVKQTLRIPEVWPLRIDSWENDPKCQIESVVSWLADIKCFESDVTASEVTLEQ